LLAGSVFLLSDNPDAFFGRHAVSVTFDIGRKRSLAGLFGASATPSAASRP